MTERHAEQSAAAASIEQLGAALEKALDHAPVADVLSILVGAFVGLTVELARRAGHDPNLAIEIKGEPGRDITIHADQTKEVRQTPCRCKRLSQVGART